MRSSDTHPTPGTAREAALAAAHAIESDPGAAHTLASLASATDTSPDRLRRAFERVFGMTPAAYARVVRAGRLRDALKSGRGVAAAGYDAGFGSDRATYEHGTRRLGMTPSAFARGGRGLTIRYAVAAADALGQVLVGATDRGVCCVLFADTPEAASDALRAEFPAADLLPDDSALAPHLAHVLGLLDGSSADGDIPLDLIGTPFQRSVWAELRRIPPGQTATYAQVARRIGEPRAVRAVAGACAGNHAALVVPCHRVVRTDGGLGGYKWGIERKQELLDREHPGN